MEKLNIGEILTLDPQTRVLSHISKPYKVTLGVSASLCLEELIKAQGAILSQDMLIDKGWRQVGIEVTTSSLRVVINQLRRAFLSLQIDKEVVIVTVPKSGYRMLAPRGSITQPVDRSDTLSEYIDSTQDITSKKKSSLQWLVFLAGSIFLGGMLAWSTNTLYWKSIVSINYIPYSEPGIKALVGDAKVYIDPFKIPSDKRIEKTISLWKDYYPEVEKWNYLYISDGTANNFHGMFGCTKPLGVQENDCLSFVFKTP